MTLRVCLLILPNSIACMSFFYRMHEHLHSLFSPIYYLWKAAARKGVDVVGAGGTVFARV